MFTWCLYRWRSQAQLCLGCVAQAIVGLQAGLPFAEVQAPTCFCWHIVCTGFVLAHVLIVAPAYSNSSAQKALLYESDMYRPLFEGLSHKLVHQLLLTK